jgi:hypothetical protein
MLVGLLIARLHVVGIFIGEGDLTLLLSNRHFQPLIKRIFTDWHTTLKKVVCIEDNAGSEIILKIFILNNYIKQL